MKELAPTLRSAIEKADPAVLAIAKAVSDLTLHEADKALDEARRTYWLIGFCGADEADACAVTSPSPAALCALALLKGQTVHGADSVLTEARFLVWMTTWADIDGSAFADRLRGHEAQKGSYDLSKLLQSPVGSC